ncbi:MAG TPA: ABC transporter permease [Candidatus Dormibacteraeota bacterium]|nr:ABC transporter permease [Candidatus Dormibacteraeota bacterium]
MMQWGESIRLALDALGVDKVKAFLTMLGVMIGSASIVLVITIASSGKAYVVGQIEGIGANLAYAALDRNGVPAVPGDELSSGDLAAVRQSLSMVTAAAGTYDIPFDFRLRGKAVRARLVGVTEEFQKIRNLLMVSGRYFDEEDFLSHAKVCLVTEHIAGNVLNHEPAIGHALQLEHLRCTIVGVFREGVPTFGQSEIQDETVLVPFPLIKTLTGEDFFQVIYAQSASSDEVPVMTSAMERLVHSRHRKAARYAVQNLSSVLGTVHTVSLAMSLVLVGVAVLTLIVAGTGIMNIMFVNVAQRTHEIGIRKALGARTAEIRLQFVLEAAFISLSGAIIGVVIAVGMIWFAFRLIEGAVPLSVSWIAVFCALLLSTGVGVLFGYRPANTAAQLNPVEALRVE